MTSERLVALKNWLQSRKVNLPRPDPNTRLIDLIDKVVRQLKIVSLASLRVASNHLRINAAIYDGTFLGQEVKATIRKTCKMIWDHASEADKLAFPSVAAQNDEVENQSERSLVGTSVLSTGEVMRLLDDCTCLGYLAMASWTEGPTNVAPDEIDTTASIENDINLLMTRTIQSECPRPGNGCLSGDAFVFRDGDFFKLEKAEGTTLPFSVSNTAWSDSIAGTAEEPSR